MTPTEITALLTLWAEHPETAPLDVVYACGTFQTTDYTFSNVHAAALARDRLVELLVEALPLCGVEIICGGTDTCVSIRFDNKDQSHLGPTRLLALIAAYRAMKGTR